KPQIIMRLGIFWTALNWVVIPTVFHFIAATPMSFAVGYCVHIVVGNLAIVLALRKATPTIRVFRAIAWPMVGALVATPTAFFGLSRLVIGPATMTAAILLTGVVYFAAIALVAPALVRDLYVAIRGESAEPAPVQNLATE